MKILKNKIVYEDNINNIKGKAAAVIFPESIDEICSAVKLCELESDIIARGSGSSFTGAVIPNNSVIIDFSKMNKILSIDSEKRTAIVEPGVLLSDLNEELKPFGLEFPIIPVFSGIETIGGMIAKNSSGNREIKYNRMINWINSLEIINSKGEHIKIAKSDLGDYTGMEGTTGIIVKASLRLTNIKQRSLTILKANTIQDVFIANRKLRLKQDISSIDLLNPFVSSLLGLENKYHIFVELENSNGAFKEKDYERYMKIKDKAYKKAATESGYIYISNAKFLVDSLQDFLIYLEERKIPYFSHLASGSVYTFFKPEEIEKINETAKLAKRLRGKIAYNFGIGLTKKDSLDSGEKELIKRVKNRQDPTNKFNKNKLLDSSFVLTDSQKNFSIKKEEKEPEKKQEQDMPVAKPNPRQNDLIAKSEISTAKKPERELSPEERDKVRKIAFGFFGAKKENLSENSKSGQTASEKKQEQKENSQINSNPQNK